MTVRLLMILVSFSFATMGHLHRHEAEAQRPDLLRKLLDAMPGARARRRRHGAGRRRGPLAQGRRRR
jgi:hypothetical protein